MRKFIIAAAFGLSFAGHAFAIDGVATVIDGDTIEIHGQRIRLFGIDTPEKRQPCWKADGSEYRCGQQASFVLADFIGRSPVSCEERDTDRYGRIVGRCFVQGKSINEYMVRSGWAMAYRRYASDYIGAEQEAKNSHRGLWSGQFQPPWDWRHQQRNGF
jgi:endonuclease YncB( thermonuclease family)